jgi:hypothetical protein
MSLRRPWWSTCGDLDHFAHAGDLFDHHRGKMGQQLTGAFEVTQQP